MRILPPPPPRFFLILASQLVLFLLLACGGAESPTESTAPTQQSEAPGCRRFRPGPGNCCCSTNRFRSSPSTSCACPQYSNRSCRSDTRGGYRTGNCCTYRSGCGCYAGRSCYGCRADSAGFHANTGF